MEQADTQDSFSLKELCREADVTERTIRYYIQEDLLPPPEGAGTAARYTREHLLRLRAIRRLKDEYLPLAEIRRRLQNVPAEDLEGIAEDITGPSIQASVEKRSSAKQYLDRLFSSNTAGKKMAEPEMKISEAKQAFLPPFPAAAPPPAPAASFAPPATPGFARSFAEDESAPSPQEGEEWRRVEIVPGVEISYRPGDEARQTLVNRLVEQARKIFNA